MKTEETAPIVIPMKSASERSSRVPGPSLAKPMTSTAMIGSTAMTVVLIERTRVWFTARFAASPYVLRRLTKAAWVFSLTWSKTTTVS